MADDHNSYDDEHEDKQFSNEEDFTEAWNEEYPSDYREETAAEQAPVRPFIVDNENRNSVEEDDHDHATTGRSAGIFAVVLSLLSLFFMPILLGIAGIVVGFIARRIGTPALGNWAIGIGAISILMKLFFSPFF